MALLPYVVAGRDAVEVILLADVPGLGTKGSLVNVSAGYARNYLLPKKLAEAWVRRASWLSTVAAKKSASHVRLGWRSRPKTSPTRSIGHRPHP